MDLTSKVNRLLAEFAGRIGLPSLSLDEEGMASLLFDEQVGVTLLLLAERERLLL
ncbi:type III secretion system regulatory chaperone ExsC, partial [Pseudomonas aeruginosa]|nr:type III secretion system regulatory chaperone ExsC [Pseudomonas aeruginosa]EKT9137224.1 type III secretion system regulatory chaperone ExsC [Pseudomonas aeruginosa]EKX2421979.1 type III secretion system regulatory chaperone ExsC [Pseudomonas aeruginosa]EKX2452882.1 type III secretion system regulatory chaperone ExsC [Pseudomonas aeruginosa]EKX2725327.1 type III secretion system regulatory chaperone ExsC [Pseudomonas aeruginosa]